MADFSGNRSGSGAALGFMVGILTGVGLALLVAPRDGITFRRDLRHRARQFKSRVVEEMHRVEAMATDLTAQGRDLADSLRVATTEGLREARRHAVRPVDPRTSRLAGVDGTAEPM